MAASSAPDVELASNMVTVHLKGIATNEDYAMLLRAAKAVGSLPAARKAWEDMLSEQVGLHENILALTVPCSY